MSDNKRIKVEQDIWSAQTTADLLKLSSDQVSVETLVHDDKYANSNNSVPRFIRKHLLISLSSCKLSISSYIN
jgi:hypothetical protein